MEQKNEKTSRIGSGALVSNVKLEVNQEERARMYTEGLNTATMEITQDYVGENHYTEDVGNIGMKHRRRSEVWKYFTEEKKPDGSPGAKCKLCNLLLSGRSNSGTSHLNRHVNLHCPRKRYKDVKQILLSFSANEHDGDTKGFKLNQEASRKNLAKLVICAGMPLNIVELPAFTNFVRGLQPYFQFVSEETIRSDCDILYEEEKDKIRSMLKNLNSRVSLTSDFWTSDQNIGYMALTVHFVDDDFVLKKKVLNFKRTFYSHKTCMINDKIAKCISEWDLVGKVFALAIDDSRIDDNLVTIYNKNWSETSLVNGNYLHVRCCAHILNIMGQDGMSVLHLAIERIRNIIKYVTNTPSHMQVFNEIAEQLGLDTSIGFTLDVSKKWNATYDMLQSALPYKEAFITYAQVYYCGTDAPTDDDWGKTEIIMTILRAFVNVINLFSRPKYPTSNLYFKEVWTIQCLLQDEIANCDEVIRNLVLRMQNKFKKYWNECDKILLIASVLDPRFKIQFIQFCYENAFGQEEAKQKVDNIRNCLYKLYNEYFERAQKTLKHATSSESSGQGLNGHGGGSNTSAHTGKRKIEMEFATFLSQNVQRRPKKKELDAYLDDDVLPSMEDEDFSVLSWWRKSAEIYPVLSKMARDVLAIPVSTVACKSAFNAFSRVKDQPNIFLSPSMVESLICTQDWLRDEYYPDASSVVHASSAVDGELFES